MTSPAPDLIVLNGNMVTMDPLIPRAEALAVSGGRIRRLGSTPEIAALKGGKTEVIDAGGRLVLPGFQDSHLHLQDSGLEFAFNIKLDRVDGIESLQRTVRDFAASHPDYPWIIGGGWNFGMFTEETLNRHVLDEAVPDRPVFLRDSSYHSAVLNTKACEAAGLTAATPNPPNGIFVRDRAGVPTGMAYEEAMQVVRQAMPANSDAKYADGVRWAQKHCNRHGITGVLDARVDARHMRVYRMLEEAGELTLRICATALVEPEDTVEGALERLTALRRDYASGMLRVHSAKFFVDGIVENRTAAMLADYSDARGGNAPLMFGENHLRELFIAFDAARFQIHVHAIGDKGVRAALDAMEAARDINGAWPSLHHIAHVQFIDPADIPRFGELGVVANLQPLWASNDRSVTEIAAGMVGPERAKYIYANRSLIEAGAPYTLSSDWGVSTLNPFPIMGTAILRQAKHMGWDTPAYNAQESIDIFQAVRGYTVNAAAALWRDRDTGSLSAGKFADLIILDRDIFSVPPQELFDTKVLTTMLGGRVVYSA
ncbi:amidohydrolase [soil metagenome]